MLKTLRNLPRQRWVGSCLKLLPPAHFPCWPSQQFVGRSSWAAGRRLKYIEHWGGDRLTETQNSSGENVRRDRCTSTGRLVDKYSIVRNSHRYTQPWTQAAWNIFQRGGRGGRPTGVLACIGEFGYLESHSRLFAWILDTGCTKSHLAIWIGLDYVECRSRDDGPWHKYGLWWRGPIRTCTSLPTCSKWAGTSATWELGTFPSPSQQFAGPCSSRRRILRTPGF